MMAEETAAEIHIVDDDSAVRDSLAFLCATSGLKANAYASPLTFLNLADALSSGCVVTDVRMPEMDGLTLIRRLRERGCRLPVIVMTGHGDVAMAVAAMKAGAADFLEKPFDDEAMLTAIRTMLVRAGGADDPARSDDAVHARLALLSERERQVLDGLLEGRANKVIANTLGISPRTVEIYRAKVMTKMEAASLAELVRMVVARQPA
jgi:two-component system response regulator FixJ